MQHGVRCRTWFGAGLCTLVGVLFGSGCRQGAGSAHTDSSPADTAVGGASCKEPSGALAEVATWMYQLNGLDLTAATTMRTAKHGLLVVEPGLDIRYCEDLDPADLPASEALERYCDPHMDPASLVEALRPPDQSEGPLLVAYVNVGQAEAYRTYWDPQTWQAPTADGPGEPSFLLAVDPDGWPDNYPVAFWDSRWWDFWVGPDGHAARLAQLGYDGVYLDWVEVYEFPPLLERWAQDPTASHTTPAYAMVEFIEAIVESGDAANGDRPFYAIMQNATGLLDLMETDEDRAWLAHVIDAIAVEDTWYYGEAAVADLAADAGVEPWVVGAGEAALQARLDCERSQCPQFDWSAAAIPGGATICPDADEANPCAASNPLLGDLHGGARHSEDYDTADRVATLHRYRCLGIPVLTADYAFSKDKARYVYERSRAEGFIPLVTEVLLSSPTGTTVE